MTITEQASQRIEWRALYRYDTAKSGFVRSYRSRYYLLATGYYTDRQIPNWNSGRSVVLVHSTKVWSNAGMLSQERFIHAFHTFLRFQDWTMIIPRSSLCSCSILSRKRIIFYGSSDAGTWTRNVLEERAAITVLVPVGRRQWWVPGLTLRGR